MSNNARRRGHVRQRGETFTAYWRTRDQDGRSVQRSKGGFPTRAAAERHVTGVLREIDTGTYTEPDRKTSRQTFAQFVRDTWLPAVQATLRPSTLASYRSNLELHALPSLGALRLQEITPERLNRLYGELLAGGRRNAGGGGLSPRTVRYVHTIVRRVLRDAAGWDRIARNPAERAQPPAVARPRMEVWRADELRRFLDHARDDRLYAAWLLFATSGMRRGEVLGLRWDDVDLDEQRLVVRQTLVAVGYDVKVSAPKTERSRRRISLDDATVAALRAHRSAQHRERLGWGELWHDSGLVFTREDGQPLHPQAVSRAFGRLVSDAGLPRVRLHDVRHSYATAALAAGVPAKVLSERLGHSSIAITGDVYQHVMPELDERAAAQVATFILEAEAGPQRPRGRK